MDLRLNVGLAHMTPSSMRLRVLHCSAGRSISLPARAQTMVRGEVRDSLTGGVFVAATIQLVSVSAPWTAGFTAVSDSTGRFVIHGVEKGRYTFGFQHPRLDSLGFEAVSRPLDVSGKDEFVTSNLALPSARARHANLCGETSDTSGAMIGRVTDAESGAAAAATMVLVEWAEIRFGVGGMDRVARRAVGAVGRDGRYVVCGVPSNTPVQLRAVPRNNESTLASGAIEMRLTPEAPLLHRDLLVARRSADTNTRVELADSKSSEDALAGDPIRSRDTTARGAAGQRLPGRARLVGVVRSASNGSPLLGARVRVPDAGLETTTASDRSFRLSDLPAGTIGVDVVTIGYAPLRTSADLIS
jgi:hypothetical protein